MTTPTIEAFTWLHTRDRGAALDRLFDLVYDYASTHAWFLLNDFVGTVSVDATDPELLIAVLTATYPWRQHLSTRTQLLEGTRERFRQEFGEARLLWLLGGLD